MKNEYKYNGTQNVPKKLLNKNSIDSNAYFVSKHKTYKKRNQKIKIRKTRSQFERKKKRLNFLVTEMPQLS